MKQGCMGLAKWVKAASERWLLHSMATRHSCAAVAQRQAERRCNLRSVPQKHASASGAPGGSTQPTHCPHPGLQLYLLAHLCRLAVNHPAIAALVCQDACIPPLH